MIIFFLLNWIFVLIFSPKDGRFCGLAWRINPQGGKVKLGIRSEFIKIANEQKDNVVNVKVIRVEDFGNFKLITGKIGDFEIKSKVEREIPISSENLKLYLPADKCCIYSEDKLVQ